MVNPELKPIKMVNKILYLHTNGLTLNTLYFKAMGNKSRKQNCNRKKI